MSDQGGASAGSGDSEQPGVTLGALGEDEPRISPDDLEIVPKDEISAPPAAPDDSAPTVNSDLVDDPEELARTIEEASGASVEVVSESEQEDLS